MSEKNASDEAGDDIKREALKTASKIVSFLQVVFERITEASLWITIVICLTICWCFWICLLPRDKVAEAPHFLEKFGELAREFGSGHLLLGLSLILNALLGLAVLLGYPILMRRIRKQGDELSEYRDRDDPNRLRSKDLTTPMQNNGNESASEAATA